MIYLIGGPARCGKSTLAARVRRSIDGQVLSGDAFVGALQDILQSSALPDIFDHHFESVSSMQTIQQKIDRLRRRDKQMWQIYDAYIKRAARDTPKDDILIEGNLWPDFMSTLNIPHRTVFLVDTADTQIERLMNIRDSGIDNNWMRHYSDEELLAWAQFNAERSRLYAQLCKTYDDAWFDIAEYGMEKAERLAFDYLMVDKV